MGRVSASISRAPVNPGPDIYRQRNVVERCINRLKQFRAIATRYAKRAAYFHSEVLIACVMLQLR